MMQNTKVASFSQPAADSPVGLGDLALLWRGLASLGRRPPDKPAEMRGA